MKRGLNFLLAAAGWLTIGAANSMASTVEMTIVVGDTARTVTITLDEAAAPQTCANFKKLCGEQFYSGILFHRVIPNYIVQAGDPLTRDLTKRADWGTGGTANVTPAEFGKKHVRGAVAAARLGDAQNPAKASHASQFYIALGEIPALDGDYTVFGNVTSGLEFLDQIASLAADENNIPLAKVEIRSMKVTEGPGRGVPPMPNLTTTTTTPAGPAPVTGSLTGTPAPAPAPAPVADGGRGIPPMPKLATTPLEPTGAAPPSSLAPAPGSNLEPTTPSAGAPVPTATSRGLPPMPKLATDPAAPSPATPSEAAPAGGFAFPSVQTPTQPGAPAAATGSDPSAGPGEPAQAPAPGSAKPEKPPGFFGRLIRRIW